MNQPDEAADAPYATRIPADISRPDRLLGPFTARQSAILAVAALVLYGGWWATRPAMAPLAYAALMVPIAGAVAALALGRREGISLDRFLLAALRHARTPKRRVHAPEGVPPLPVVVPDRWAQAAGPPPAAMRMPYDGITAEGVLDLGGEGKAAVATCSTVNFELRSTAEQQGLTAAFARWLNSLTGPTQLLVRCHRIDLAPLADTLQQDAAALPHPALEQAARAHADFLARPRHRRQPARPAHRAGRPRRSRSARCAAPRGRRASHPARPRSHPSARRCRDHRHCPGCRAER